MSTPPVKSSNKRKLTSTDDKVPDPRKHLRIEIPTEAPTHSASTHSATTSYSSLFSATSLFSDDLGNSASPTTTANIKPAMTTAPPIPGLYFIPSLKIPLNLADSVTSFCLSTYFKNPDINQIMLFTRFTPESPSSLPPILLDLLCTLSYLLKPYIPDQIHNLLFPDAPTQARQVILNLYTPGEGISPHVDLLNRFGDGIIGVSLGSGCVMQFARSSGVESGDNGPTRTSFLDEPVRSPVLTTNCSSDEMENDNFDLYLPERSILILSSDARYKWTHGIEKRKSDFIAQPSFHCRASPNSTGPSTSNGHCIDRGIRLSVTFRWLLPGADVVGDEDDESEVPAI
jgi:hypothetical protein